MSDKIRLDEDQLAYELESPPYAEYDVTNLWRILVSLLARIEALESKSVSK